MKKITAILLILTLLVTPAALAVHAEGDAASSFDFDAYYNSVFTDNVPLTDKDVAEFIRYDEVSYFDEDGNLRYVNNRRAFNFTTYDEGYAVFLNDPEAFYNAVGLKYIDPTEGEQRVFIDQSFTCGVQEYVNGEFVLDHTEYTYQVILPYTGVRFDVIDYLYYEAKVWNQLRHASASAPFLMYPGSMGDRLIPGVCPATGTEVYYNDVNYDGAFNIKDLTYFKRYAAGIESRINITAADRDGDGAATVKDMAKIKRAIAGSQPTTGDEVTGVNYVYLKANHPHLERNWDQSWASCLVEGANDTYKTYVENYFGAEGGIISTYEDYTAFCEGIPLHILREVGPVKESDGLTYVYRYYFALPELDASFFTSNVLAVGYVFSPCCNYTQTVDEVTVNGDTVTVCVTSHESEIGLDAIEEYAVFVAVEKGYAAGATSAVFPVTSVYESES